MVVFGAKARFVSSTPPWLILTLTSLLIFALLTAVGIIANILRLVPLAFKIATGAWHAIQSIAGGHCLKRIVERV